MKIINLKTLIFLKYKSRIWNLISNMVLTFTIKLRLKEICFFYFKYFQKKTKTNLYLIIIKYGIFKDIKRIITMFKQCSWLRLTLSLSVCFFQVESGNLELVFEGQIYRAISSTSMVIDIDVTTEKSSGEGRNNMSVIIGAVGGSIGILVIIMCIIAFVSILITSKHCWNQQPYAFS